MIKKIKSAVSIIENEKECVQSDCDRDCSRCELVKEESEIVSAFDLAIRSLHAWEEVLQELEEKKEQESRAIIIDYEWKSALDMCIDIINKHL